MAKVITYECKECGCEIVVSGSHESHLRPIYCCGIEVAKISAAKKKTAKKPLKKAVSKVAKKTAAAERAQKSAPAKKASRK